jgi:hypothetical protein
MTINGRGYFLKGRSLDLDFNPYTPRMVFSYPSMESCYQT